MGNGHNTADGQHHTALQSARGIAALTVLVSHCLLYFKLDGYLIDTARVFEILSHMSVVFFFVLSGFVLSLSLRVGRSVPAFYIRRLWRIYPALWAASALALVYVLFIHRALPEQSDWFRQFFSPTMRDANHIVASFLALDLFLITPAWTIFVELLASAFMPAITLATRNAYMNALALLAATLLAFVYPGMLYAGTYLVCFVIGAAFAANRTAGSLGYLLARPLYARLLPVGLLFGAFAFRWAGHWSFHSPLPTIVEAIAAAFCVHLLASANRPSLLKSPAVTRLGDVSYSLYLFHFPIMCIFGVWISGLGISATGATAILVLSTIIVTYAVSEISYRYIEMSGIRAGRWMAGLLHR